MKTYHLGQLLVMSFEAEPDDTSTASTLHVQFREYCIKFASGQVVGPPDHQQVVAMAKAARGSSPSRVSLPSLVAGALMRMGEGDWLGGEGQEGSLVDAEVGLLADPADYVVSVIP